MTDIKPDYLLQIPAKREGIYRSRLEAKFAAFWARDWPDHPALYEPYRLQAFHGKGRGRKVACTYLPDFVIPSARIIVEVKPHPSLVDLYGMRELVKAITACGWLFMSWGDRPKAYADNMALPSADSYENGWSILGDGYLEHVGQLGDGMSQLDSDYPYHRHPYGTARNVRMARCGSCGGPSPNFNGTDDWAYHCELDEIREQEWHEYDSWILWGCFGCGGKVSRGNGSPVLDLPRRERLRALYGVNDAE